ncbi:hypothetical protein KCP76_06085 [Salmonella enterica subsp. enterica serovar Weltevreden]|nr:hypothetical protein KCP76_06085 [Salmonella enterica subsp. enterica serovar Weltevreden]
MITSSEQGRDRGTLRRFAFCHVGDNDDARSRCELRAMLRPSSSAAIISILKAAIQSLRNMKWDDACEVRRRGFETYH